MEHENEISWSDFFVGFYIGLFVMFILMNIFSSPKQYKKGQVNAINGQIEYELVTRPDSTRKWELIE